LKDRRPVPQDLPNGKTETELGWHVRRDRQGWGYATEAASAWMGEMFGRGEAHLIALVRPENRPSCRVAEKIGMHIEEDILWNAELKWPHHVYGVSNPNLDQAVAPVPFEGTFIHARVWECP